MDDNLIKFYGFFYFKDCGLPEISGTKGLLCLVITMKVVDKNSITSWH